MPPLAAGQAGAGFATDLIARLNPIEILAQPRHKQGMDFDLSETQQLFRDTTLRFCGPGDTAARHAARRQPGGLDRARWQELAGLGLIGLAAGEGDGGLDGSLGDCATVAQALGEGLAVEPWLECGFIPARLLTGNALAAGVIAGTALATLAFAEPGRRFRTDPALETAGGKLSGAKTFVPCGGAADLFLVTARHEGRSAVFAVPRDAAGLTVQSYPVADGSHAAQLVLDGVAHGEPLAADIDAVIDEARLVAAAELVGLARRLLADTLEYVKTREQFGQPIGRFQVIQHRLVDAYARVEAAQSALYRALLKPGAPPAAVKGFIADAAQWVGQQAVQLHGGMGMTDELAIGHGLKRIVLLGKLFGDAAGGIAAYGREAA